jgi:hydroxymethylglutaryl-CoA lyase
VNLPAAVRIREVGPRDGIQSERAAIPTRRKAELIDALSATGLRYIEAVSFVSPRAVPQMADAIDVWRAVARRPEVFYSALVPNRRGAETAVEAGLDGLQVFVAATDGYNSRNLGRTVEGSLRDVAEVAAVGRASAVAVEASLSCAFGCPYEGDVAPERVVEVARRIVAEGIGVLSLGDTTGMATPRRVRDVVFALRAELPQLELNMHFHDTRGTGLANVVTAMDLGISYFDASVGGMGGSPFATGASGNIATEDLVHMLEDSNVSTGVSLDALLAAARLAQELVEGELPGRVLKAGPRAALPARPSRSA